MNYTEALASMTVSQFKAFRKALAVLVRAGVPFSDAIELLLAARHHKSQPYAVTAR